MDAQSSTYSQTLASTWNRKYSRKKPEGKFRPEDKKLLPQISFDENGRKDLLHAFFTFAKRKLDPPEDLRYAALHDFLSRADFSSVSQLSSGDKRVVLDERKDPNGYPNSTRVWDDDGPNGYMRRPPTGDKGSIFHECLSLSEFVRRVNGTAV